MLMYKLNLCVKNSCSYSVLKYHLKNLHTCNGVVDILTKYFELPNLYAEVFSRKNNLFKHDVDQIKDTINLLETIGFNKAQILKHPNLLVRSALCLNQQTNALREGGFQKIDPNCLAKYRSVTNKPILQLKRKKYIPSNVNVAESFASYLDPQPNNLDLTDLDDEKSWSFTHSQLLKRYLMWRLEATKEEIEILFRTYKFSTSKSFKYVCENITLTQELNFKPIRILLNFGYLISMHPQNPKTVLSTMPNIAGADVKASMRRYPKLTTVAPKNYVQVYNILKEFGIPDETIQKTMIVFSVAPATLEKRLGTIDRIPQFRIHLHNPNVLRLVVHQDRALDRLQLLKAIKLRCNSLLHMSSDENEYFEKHIRDGKDENVRNEVIRFVKHLLKTDDKFIRKNLVKHKYYVNVPFEDIEETFEFLRNYGFSSENIAKVVSILLYPKDKIKSAFEIISQDTRISSWDISPRQKLNLALYYMEKEHHFSGCAV